jgi:hypothetical protein
MSLTDAEKNRLKKVGLTGLNKPKRTPNHPTKKGVVAVRDGKKMKIIRFGDQKMGHNYSDEVRQVIVYIILYNIRLNATYNCVSFTTGA